MEKPKTVSKRQILYHFLKNFVSVCVRGGREGKTTGLDCRIKAYCLFVGPGHLGENPPCESFKGNLARIYASFIENYRKNQMARSRNATRD